MLERFFFLIVLVEDIDGDSITLMAGLSMWDLAKAVKIKMAYTVSQLPHPARPCQKCAFQMFTT